MTRMAPTAAGLTLIQGFVLGRLRDAGPMSSNDFREARRGELDNGSTEWAKPVLNSLRDRGYATSEKAGRSQVFTITPAGHDAIVDMPPTPARLIAFPDRDGSSLCLHRARRWLRDDDPAAVTLEDVRNGTGLTGDLDDAETAELVRIGRIITGRDLSPPAEDGPTPG